VCRYRFCTVQGSFSSDALQAYKTLIAEQHPSDFSEGGTYDFTRCVRKDGTVYGTAGQCRKGTEEAKESVSREKVKGKGTKKTVKSTPPGKPLPPELHSSISKLSEKLSDKKMLATPQQRASASGLEPGEGKSGEAKATKKEVLEDIKSILEENRGPREVSKKVNSAGLTHEEEIAVMVDTELARDGYIRQGDPKYDGWSRAFDKEAKILGSGIYGTAILSPDGEVVKRGLISRTEAAVMDKVGKADLGPRLIAADITNKPFFPTRKVTGLDLRNGRIAMTKVEGTPLGEIQNRDSSRANTDSYWKARADLHRMGVAHNDMHEYNVLVDDKGKGRFVDMGSAQDNPKAALVEALGAFPGPKGKSADAAFSNWGPGGNLISDVERKKITPKQRANYLAFLKEDAPLAYKAYTNKERAIEKLRSFGIDGEDMTKVLTTKTSTRDEKYKVGPWAKLSDKQAMEVINTLYEGI
jgi:hypothetical protein